MADVDIDPFGEHDRTEEPTDENIPLDPVTPGGPKGTLPQNVNRKHHSEAVRPLFAEVQVVQVYFTKNI